MSESRITGELKSIDWNGIISALDQGFASGVETPPRQKHTTDPSGSKLIVMPAWGYKGYGGLKVITTTPNNETNDLPYIQGVYHLFKIADGQFAIEIDGAFLTNLRTAAASALASSYLSKKDSKGLLMVGAGNLAPYLIAAHKAIRPIEEVYVWSRNHVNAVELAKAHGYTAVKDIANVASKVDIISCATPSTSALVLGDMLHPGQHIDLVGGFTPAMRETDDAVIHMSTVFVDVEMALEEAGDLIQPMHHGTWRRNQLKGTLYDLCTQKITGRSSDEEITLFKSVGTALEDLVAAVWLHNS